MTRSHGTIGTIAVDYSVVYLAEGVSDPSAGDPSVFAMASGSVRLVGGQTMAEWDLEVLDEAFLDTSAQFYVKLNSTYLVEGGKIYITEDWIELDVLCDVYNIIFHVRQCVN